MFSIDNTARRAHRVAVMLSHDDINTLDDIPGDVIRHKCHNRRCVNPSHLTPGSRADNIMDSVQTGDIDLYFDPDDIREIRALAGELTQYQIADRFGVDQTTISVIVRREQYAWVD
jgi:hypothetical protein